MSQFIFSAFITTTVFNFVGFLASLFIAVASYKIWMQNRTMSPSERVLLSLAITRLLLLGQYLLCVMAVLLFEIVLRSVLFLTFSTLWWMFLDSTSLWFMTLLNTLYCVKITNFQHSAFLLLKRNLSSKLPGLLLVCVLVSAFTTLLYFVLKLTSPFPLFALGTNVTEIDISSETLPVLVSWVFSSGLRFILNVVSTSLVIHSLWRHVQKMQKGNTKFWNPQMKAHVNAMKLMVYFLVSYVPHSVTIMLFFLVLSVGRSPERLPVYAIFSSFYHPGHSVLIVLTHPKLKAEAKKMLGFK